MNVFLNEILVNSNFYLDKIKNEMIPLLASSRESEIARNTKECYVCGNQIDTTIITSKQAVLIIYHMDKRFDIHVKNLIAECLA